MMNSGRRNENQDKKQIKKMEKKNQNEESKSSGIELLENVIKSNERNIASIEESIQQNVKVQFDIEDLINLYGHTENTLRKVNTKYNEVLKLYKIEQSKRTEFLANIPTKTETVLSKETVDFYENLQKRMKRNEKFVWGGWGTFILGIFTLIISINFATDWYKESIKAKSELRQDILNEIADDGKKIYNENEIKTLIENTQVMQLWIKKNPTKAEDFVRFKDGFIANNENK